MAAVQLSRSCLRKLFTCKCLYIDCNWRANVISSYVWCTYLYASLNYVRNYLFIVVIVCKHACAGLLSSDKYVPETNLELEHLLVLCTTDALMCIVIMMGLS